jgi:predicted GIY-YIG superfamily endonuclease
MLKVMQEKKNRRRKRIPEDPWLLYILECNDRSFYTGVTNNLERRLKAHETGRASRFTRSRLPVRLVYSESCPGRTEALVRECAVKSLSRKAKEALVSGHVAP